MIDIDELGRRAGTWARNTDLEHDVDARLDDLVRTVRRRRQVKVSGALAGVVLLVGGLGWGVSNLNQATGPTSTDRVRGDVVGGAPYTSSGDVCGLDIVTCKGPARSHMTFQMAAPMSWQRPNNVSSLMNVRSNESGSRAVSVESNRRDDSAGVVVSLPVRPVTPDGPGAAAQLGARDLAEWIADRPSIEASPVTRGTLDNLQTWSVQVRLGSPKLAGRCSDEAIAASLWCGPSAIEAIPLSSCSRAWSAGSP